MKEIIMGKHNIMGNTYTEITLWESRVFQTAHWEDDGATVRSEGVPASLFHLMPFFSGPLCSNPELGTNLYLDLYLQFKDKPH